MRQTHKVITGPAGHWYALSETAGRDHLIGRPMSADEDMTKPPAHPEVSGDWIGWLEISDPAPETDVDALIAELKR